VDNTAFYINIEILLLKCVRACVRAATG